MRQEFILSLSKGLTKRIYLRVIPACELHTNPGTSFLRRRESTLFNIKMLLCFLNVKNKAGFPLSRK